MKEEPQKFWTSLDEWRETPEFKELASKEFVSSPFAPEDANSPWARREFLKLMGASLALTSFGCTRAAQKIVPYANRPEEIIPGIANVYASTVVDSGEVFGSLVTTREGRPVKLAGNEQHTGNRGGMSARAHATIMDLYDPDRLNGPKKNLLNEKRTNRDTINISWSDLDKEVVAALAKGSSAILTRSLTSPSTKKLLGEFRNAFGTDIYTWDGVSHDDIREAQKLSYGKSVLPKPRIDRAKLILSFGADFLGTHLSPTEFTKDFSSNRNPNGEMNRLVMFEPSLSLTGSNADERHRVKPSQLKDVVMGILHELVFVQKRGSYVNDSTVRSVLEPYAGIYRKLGFDSNIMSDLAEELWQKRGESLAIAGGLTGKTGNLDLHIAVNFLNSVLGNDGKTVDYDHMNYATHNGSVGDLKSLIDKMNGGKVKTLIIHEANPEYMAPTSGFAAAMLNVDKVIFVGQYLDETAEHAHLVATNNNALESWGDHEVQDGVLSIQQPTIRPLYNTRSFEDSLMSWARTAKKGRSSLRGDSFYDYLVDAWKGHYSRHGRKYGDFEDFWVKMRQEGVLITKDGKKSSSSRRFSTRALSQITPFEATELEVHMYETVGLRDGTLGNVSWLQEFPDPITKICWDNYALVSPKSASNNGLKENDVIRLKVNGVIHQLPVHIQPGQHDEVISVAVGYGRRSGGRVANDVGVNAYQFVSVRGDSMVFSGASASFTKTEECYKLANVQSHHSMEGRQIVVEATLAKYQTDPDHVVHRHKVFSAWDKHKYTGRKWGMSIDLSSCTGCGTCVIACQSENNIPTVGKKYILQGREMHWMRIDRYHVGSPDNPDTVYQPINCLHCDNAPCETVCPVAATTHGDEGTNDMIYNRCVGTRYCANNCPYKVRRFNWFSYTDVDSPLHLAMNPEVTVRHRGVMEKCTFCLHRIKDAKRQFNIDKDEKVFKNLKTACQESCPANAIVFGDQNDSESKVTEDFSDQRTYSLLEELNTVPNVRYKYKVRNTAQLKSSHGKKDGGHH